MFEENEPIEENAKYLFVCSGIHVDQSIDGADILFIIFRDFLLAVCRIWHASGRK